MKNILKTVGISFIACLTFSCSSDDNKGETPEESTSIVLDQMEELEYDSGYNITGELNELALFRKTTYVLHYDEKGRVAVIDIDNLDEIPFPEDSHSITKSKLTYNDASQLIRFYVVDTENGEEWGDTQFEYDTQGLLVKSVDYVDKETAHYQFNEKKQLVSLKVITDHGYEENYAYEYDERGNIIRLSDVNEYSTFAYDTNKTPYANMNVNFMYDYFDNTRYLSYLKIGMNNILSYKDSYGELVMKHVLNAEGYPIESTGSFNSENRIKRIVYKYTYKSIKIKK